MSKILTGLGVSPGIAIGAPVVHETRPISTLRITIPSDQVESEVQHLGKAEIPSRVIGDMVMERLRDLDELAYILFASVYLPLTDLESMKEEVDHLLDHRSGN